MKDVLARGWIEPCPASGWASNGGVVPRREKGQWCLVVDCRQPNPAILPDEHPLPLIENVLENESKHKILTIVDLSKGFHPMCARATAGAKPHKQDEGVSTEDFSACRLHRLLFFTFFTFFYIL